MSYGGMRKRGNPEAGVVNGNGGSFKRSKQEGETNTSGIGSKSKPCTKFFSTSGCPFGEGCHFMHYVPGGFKAVSQMLNLGSIPSVAPPSRHPPAPFPESPSSQSVKTRLCNKYNTAEGCKFGDKCHFAHGEWELGKSATSSFEDPRFMAAPPGRYGGRGEPHRPGSGLSDAAASFGTSATAKISIDGSLAGPIIGRNGVNSKQVSRVTGVKLSIRDHDTDPNLRNIVLEGTFDQIKQASIMVRELIANISSGHGMKNHGAPHAPRSNFKTKLCDNFAKGSCNFGDRCHFAHGMEELSRPGI
ncbi:hypothetical protein MLD38_007348 [Melastoma candidum]|uniref:Uncharacterized protein n=1 Tax=Melastoma candidum TaxID=119954 RepID=A0ACB9RQ29_9MYRT|nr:hypothetical protein MLD38_007348 [Melastoma candidum]